MSPDENHVGGNDLYTNLLAKHTIDTYAHERFPQGIPMVLPHDEVSFLNYDGDRFRAYKQSAAILSIYPLQHPAAEREAAVMMGRFADKVMDTGPAMSRSLDALIWARLGESDKAYDAWHQSWKDFVKPPLMLFAEKRQVPVTYFTTGAAGSLQTVLFGFLGIRIDSQKDPAASWSKKLIGEHWLTIKPHLPKAWKSVKLKNFCVLGHRYTLFATHSGVTVTQGD
jgi:trehalose/maltose hydrolase-like predicted phosphorylase